MEDIVAGVLGRGAVPIAVAALAGCEPTGVNRLAPDSAGDTGVAFTSGSEPDPATQVGSEGFWDCPTERTEPVADPGAPLPSLDGSAVDLAAAHVGSFPLRIVDAASKLEVAGSLDLADRGVYTWVDVADGVTGCVDYLQAEVAGTLVREASSAAVAGVIAIRPGGAQLLASDTGDLAALAATWGAPTLPGVVGFRVQAALAPDLLDGHAAYVDCPPTAVACPGVEIVARVSGAR